MRWTVALVMIGVIGLLAQCSSTREIPQSEERIRQLKNSSVKAYHDPVQLQIAWVPYTQHSLELTSKNEWKVVKDASRDTSSALPMILLTYPAGEDTLWLDMNTDNELLGRLLKHTLMTQEPISRPFTNYIEIAKCSNCHPEHIEIPFQ